MQFTDGGCWSCHNYQFLRKLGQGAFGEVLLVRVVETGEVVAIKRIFIRGTQDGIPDNVVREYKALQSLDHPNIVQLRDVYPKGHALMFVLEYCCTDLSRFLRASSDLLPERIVKGILWQIIEGLKKCHSEGIMHRDLKPSNVLINHQGVIKLADFGLARPMARCDRPTYTHTVATRWYRAPELLFGATSYGPGVDMWAVGCIFAELLGLGPLIPGEGDIEQLSRMIHTLGSMERSWPDVCGLPDYGKINFPYCEGKPLSDLLPDASPSALDFLAEFLSYDPEQRISAPAAARHDYLLSEPLPATCAELAAWLQQLNLANSTSSGAMG